MRRAHLEAKRAEMEVQQKNVLQAHLENSQFAKKLLGIPMFKAAVDTAGGAYVKVKDSKGLVGKSLELALNISSAVVYKLTPFAEKGINAASPLTTKVDAIAAASLEGLIARVPVINEEPQEIVHSTRTAIEKRVTVINGYTVAAMSTWPVQSAMDIYESILTTACNTLDNVLPPSKDDQDENGLAPTKDSLGEEEKHKRGVMLAQRTYHMFSTAFKRVFGICQTQVENAANATDIMYKQVRNAVSDNNSSPPPSQQQQQQQQQNADQNNVANNGDTSKQGNKKGKKKNGQD